MSHGDAPMREPAGQPGTGSVSGSHASGQPDAQTLQLLFLRHSQSIRAYVRGLTPPHLDPEEIFQETFLAAMSKAGDFRPDAPFLPWVFGIARIKVLRYTCDRRGRGEQALPPDVLDLLCETVAPEDEVEPQLVALRRCMERLSQPAYRLMRLFYFERRSGTAIARDMGIRPRSVYNALNRARLRLRACIERELGQQESGDV